MCSPVIDESTMNLPATEPEFALTIGVVARRLGRSTVRVRQIVAKGRLRFICLPESGLRLFSAADVDKLLAERAAREAAKGARP
jgi:hypothetical protein